MPWPLAEILLALPVYALVLFRISGLMMVAPVFASRAIPLRLRAAFTLVLAAMVFPIVRGQAPADVSLATALVGGVGELMIGLSMGLAFSIFMVGAEVAGLLVGRQGGIALGQVFDPTLNQDRSITGQIYAIVLVLVFLLAGGHRAMLAALLDTYRVIPLLSFEFGETIIVLLVEMLAATFMLGIRLAGPVLIALFMTSTAMAFLSRTMPQFNILTVGFTIRVFMAMAVAGLVLGACQDVLLDAIWDAVTLVRSAFGLDPNRTHLVM